MGLRHLHHRLGVDDKAIVVLELDLETEVAAVFREVPCLIRGDVDGYRRLEEACEVL